jgi:hypothetical protein
MPPSPDLIADLDRRIAAAHRDLDVTRQRFRTTTPGSGAAVCAAAEAAIDELLELRFALTAGTWAGSPG